MEQIHEPEWQENRNRVVTCTEADPPPCAVRCPFGLDINDLIARLQKGQTDAALRKYVNTVSFPKIVSEACDAPCKAHCLMERHGGAIDLRMIEQALLRHAREIKPNRINLPKKNTRIAIVGGGMSGVGCALRLAVRKYPVTVFEKTARTGGVLNDILGEETVRSEIEKQFQYESCEWRTETEVTDPEALFAEGFSAVYIATGKDGNDFGLLPAHGGRLIPGTREGVLFGGMVLNVTPMEALAQGFRAAALIEGYLKTGIMRPQGEAVQTKTAIAYRFLKDAEAVIPVDGTVFSKEELQAEAMRCKRCRCDACMRSCGLMEFYQKVPKRIGDEAYVSVRPGTLDGTGTVATRLIASCNHCSRCTDVCPIDIDLDRYLLQSHYLMKEKGLMPWVYHEFWLRDMAFSNKEAAVVRIDEAAGCNYLFFPGCRIGSSDERYVTEMFSALRAIDPATGLFVSCCGAPAVWGVDDGAHEQALANIRTVWEQADRPVVLLNCPTCEKMFDTYLPEIETRSLYVYLDEAGFAPKKNGNGETLFVFDPCATGKKEDWKQSVRSLAGKAGYRTEEGTGEALCCSFGGHVDIANPVYTDWLVKQRTSLSAHPYLTYCINCRDTFAGDGKETLHLFDVLLDLNDKKRLPPGINERHVRKLALKRFYTGEEHMKQSADILHEIDDALREKLDLEHLILEDVAEVVAFCEAENEKVLDTKENCFIGHKKIGNITCWVSYRREGERYRLLNAYAHRMGIASEMERDEYKR